MALSTLAPSALTLSSGIFAGMSLGISRVSIPGIVASNDPLPTWRETYNNGKLIALTCIAVSTVSGIKCFYDTGSTDYRFLAVAGLSMAVGLWTGAFMVGINNTMFAIKDVDRAGEDKRIRNLIQQWSSWQWGRTALSFAAFAVNVWIINSK